MYMYIDKQSCIYPVPRSFFLCLLFLYLSSFVFFLFTAISLLSSSLSTTLYFSVCFARFIECICSICAQYIIILTQTFQWTMRLFLFLSPTCFPSIALALAFVPALVLFPCPLYLSYPPRFCSAFFVSFIVSFLESEAFLCSHIFLRFFSIRFAICIYRFFVLI